MNPNKHRHPDYFTLRNRINDCTKPEQLESLRQVVVATNGLMSGTKWEDDGINLMIIFMQKEAEFEALTDIEINKLIESRHHNNSFHRN